jgi:hypothetical protein
VREMFRARTVVLLLGILVLWGVSLNQAAEGQETMSHAQFASILVQTLGIEMPEGSDQLSDAEFFEVQANMLAERGVTLFADGRPDELVTRCDLGDVLYDALVGPNEASIEEKLGYLMQNNYIGSDSGYSCVIMPAADIVDTLNVPELSAAVAEAYSPVMPGLGLLGAEGGINTIAPAPKNPERESRPRTESFASPI